MSLSTSANSRREDLSAYIDKIMECASTDGNGEIDIEKLLDHHLIDKATNQIIADLIRADFSKYSKVRGSLKQFLIEANQKQLELQNRNNNRKSNRNSDLVNA